MSSQNIEWRGSTGSEPEQPKSSSSLLRAAKWCGTVPFRAAFHIVVDGDWTGWLGREDSNLRISL
jgi:hypothetical protein